MDDPNINDQLLTVPKLAEELASDPSFVYEIGLDEFSHSEIVQRLTLVIGFVFAMYNTAKSIFKSLEYPTLDDKFIELIYSRIRLMPEIVQSEPEPRDYAKECYSTAKRRIYESARNWGDLTLYEQFFEICVRVFLEEMKIDRPDLYLSMPEFEEISSRSIMTKIFKGIFSNIKWELVNKAELTQRCKLSTKKGLGPESSLKEFPLLYLYFDNFSEIVKVWNQGCLEIWKDDIDIRSGRILRDEIMKDEKLFLELYKNNLLRLKVNRDTELSRDIEKIYWDRIIHPEKFAHELSSSSDADEELVAYMKELRNKIDVDIEAIKRRYGLANKANLENRNVPGCYKHNDIDRQKDKRLTRAEKLITVLYYYEGMAVKEIAATLDLSEACVSQILNRLESEM